MQHAGSRPSGSAGSRSCVAQPLAAAGPQTTRRAVRSFSHSPCHRCGLPPRPPPAPLPPTPATAPVLWLSCAAPRLRRQAWCARGARSRRARRRRRSCPARMRYARHRRRCTLLCRWLLSSPGPWLTRRLGLSGADPGLPPRPLEAARRGLPRRARQAEQAQSCRCARGARRSLCAASSSLTRRCCAQYRTPTRAARRTKSPRSMR